MRGALLLLVPALGWGQSHAAILKRGSDIFAKSCATGYCHGVKGAAGGAPRLAARGFDEAFILSVTRDGVPGTAMQAFGSTLPPTDLAAVVGYVARLNGIAASQNGAAAAAPQQTRTLSAKAAAGRELFFDSVRGFARCATCHQADGSGIAVTTPMTKIPADARALRDLATPQVRTAIVDGDMFPALIISQGIRRTTFYDLTSPPPVLRSVDSTAIKIGAASPWRHAAVVGSYREPELESILAFLRAVSRP